MSKILWSHLRAVYSKVAGTVNGDQNMWQRHQDVHIRTPWALEIPAWWRKMSQREERVRDSYQLKYRTIQGCWWRPWCYGKQHRPWQWGWEWRRQRCRVAGADLIWTELVFSALLCERWECLRLSEMWRGSSWAEQRQWWKSGKRGNISRRATCLVEYS